MSTVYLKLRDRVSYSEGHYAPEDGSTITFLQTYPWSAK